MGKLKFPYESPKKYDLKEVIKTLSKNHNLSCDVIVTSKWFNFNEKATVICHGSDEDVVNFYRELKDRMISLELCDESDFGITSIKQQIN